MKFSIALILLFVTATSCAPSEEKEVTDALESYLDFCQPFFTQTSNAFLTRETVAKDYESAAEDPNRVLDEERVARCRELVEAEDCSAAAASCLELYVGVFDLGEGCETSNQCASGFCRTSGACGESETPVPFGESCDDPFECGINAFCDGFQICDSYFDVAESGELCTSCDDPIETVL